MKSKERILDQAMINSMKTTYKTDDTIGAQTDYQCGYMQGYADACRENKFVIQDCLTGEDSEPLMPVYACVDMASTCILAGAFILHWVGCLNSTGVIAEIVFSGLCWLGSFIYQAVNNKL